MTDQDIYLLYSSQWRTLDDSIDDLTRQAQNFVEADKLINAWETAENNYSRARRLIFTSHTAQIQLILADFKSAKEKADQALKDLQNNVTTISTFASLISSATNRGKEVVEKVKELDAKA